MESEAASRRLLEELYPLLMRHYNWWRQSQAGNNSTIYPRPKNSIVGESYRWGGRTPKHTLTRGLDDYPRADPPHPAELHVDAMAWVGAAADALQKLAAFLGKRSDAHMLGMQAGVIRHNLDALHWSETHKAYCDATVGATGGYEHVCHVGYVSLMPFVLGHLNGTHKALPAVLDAMADPEQLWSPCGLRSLSRKDANYGKDEDYWRGAVWMNINVLAIKRLWQLGMERGPHSRRARQLAIELRTHVVDAVYRSWSETGFFWEQYDDKTGQGKRSRAFTGWTACVLLVMGLRADGHAPSFGTLSDTTFRYGDSLPSSQNLAGVAVVLVILAVFRRRFLAFGRSITSGFRR